MPLLRRGREFSPHPDRASPYPRGHPRRLVIWSAYQRLIVGEADRIEALLPEAIELVLRPYIGERDAEQFARDAIGESQPETDDIGGGARVSAQDESDPRRPRPERERIRQALLDLCFESGYQQVTLPVLIDAPRS